MKSLVGVQEGETLFTHSCMRKARKNVSARRAGGQGGTPCRRSACWTL